MVVFSNEVNTNRMDYFLPTDKKWVQGRGYRKQILLREAELNCPGTLVQLIEIAPHMEVPFHHHEKQTEVFHITEGQGYMVINGQRMELRPGVTLTTQPGDVHNTVNEGDVPLRYVVFKTNWSEDDTIWPQAY